MKTGHKNLVLLKDVRYHENPTLNFQHNIAINMKIKFVIS